MGRGRNAMAISQDLVDDARDAGTDKHRRTRLFVMTLGYSRKSVRRIAPSWLKSSWPHHPAAVDQSDSVTHLASGPEDDAVEEHTNGPADVRDAIGRIRNR